MLVIIRQLLIFIFVFFLTLSLVVMSGISYLFYYYKDNVPSHENLLHYEPSISTRFYSYDGKLLKQYAKEARVYVPIEQVPDIIIQSFLVAEDKNFYEHVGIDIVSIVRAVIQNVINVLQGKSMVGGSTITQQVVKNFLLTNERSVSRKIKEAILSFRLNNALTKDRILELYLNQIYLGSGAYGVAAASLNYFNKSLDDLSIEEAALLAGMPKAPGSFSPKRNYQRALERRNWVISRLVEEGYIDNLSATKATSTPIIMNSRAQEEVVEANFFADAVSKNIINMYGNNILYEGGLMVHTTINSKLQLIAEEALRSGLEEYDIRAHGYRPLMHLDDVSSWQKFIHCNPHIAGRKIAIIKNVNDHGIVEVETYAKKILTLDKDFVLNFAKRHKIGKDIFKVGDVILVKISSDRRVLPTQIPKSNGGMIVMDIHTGRILAMVGGYDYNKSKFNRVTQAHRQTGSIFKPFVYLSALESGITPNTIINDAPIELYQGPNLPLWKPQNYLKNYLGPVTLRTGLEKSRNIVTVKIGQVVGIKKVKEVTNRFGIDAGKEENFATLLGASESTLLDMTSAYSMIANGGKLIKPTMIERIQDRYGKTTYRRDQRFCDTCIVDSEISYEEVVEPITNDYRENVTDERTAYQAISLLEGSVARGTSRRAKSPKLNIMAKTGTSNDSKDAWFIACTPDIAVGIYAGHDTPRDLGKRESGATVALPVFNKLRDLWFSQDDISADLVLRNKSFDVPEGISLVNVDKNTGMFAYGDSNEIIMEAFKTGTEPYSHDKAPQLSDLLDDEGDDENYDEEDNKELVDELSDKSQSMREEITKNIDGTGGIY